MKKSIKIDALVSTAKCPCGNYKVYNYDSIMNYSEINSTIDKCPECSLKYKVRYNPITKKMHFINKETDKAVYTYIDSVKMTKISKAEHDSDYKYSLEELDYLEEISEPCFEIKPVEISISQIF